MTVPGPKHTITVTPFIRRLDRQETSVSHKQKTYDIQMRPYALSS